MSTTETEKQRKWQEIREVIESDPDLFLAMAAETKVGRRILTALRTLDAQEQAQAASSAAREVIEAEALESLAKLDKNQYKRIHRDFMDGDDQLGSVGGNIAVVDLVKLIEYGRQQLIKNNPNLYVLQDSRSLADNKMLFWAKDASGYTTDLSKAHRFTKEEAQAQHASRETDIPHRVGDLSPATSTMLAAAAKAQVSQSKKHHAATPDRFAEPATKPIDAHDIDTLALEERFSKHEHGDTPVLIIRDAEAPDRIETILVDPPQYQSDRYTQNSSYLTETTNLSSLASRFWAIPNVQEAMTHYNWSLLRDLMADSLDTLESASDTQSAVLTDNVPSDLPERVSSRRLELVDRFATPSSTPGKMRLTELVMAARYGEPVNDTLFIDERFKNPDKSWRKGIEEGDIGQLAEWHDSIQYDLKQLEGEFRHLEQKKVSAWHNQLEDSKAALHFMRDCLNQELFENELMHDQMTTHMARVERQLESADLVADLDDDEPSLRMG